jgi:hypothetical protein
MRAIAAAALLVVSSGALAQSRIVGDYVEARTLNVYIGACHANGEMVTTGKEGMMAWNFREGAVDGVSLQGVRAVAIVAAPGNLAFAGPRRSMIVVDKNASPAQRDAVLKLLSANYEAALGEITGVKSLPVEFGSRGLEYTVRIPSVAYIKTTRYKCDHCVMPHNIWASPLVPLKSSLVARTSLQEYKGTAGFPGQWKRVDDNSSYVGTFEL